MKHRLVKLTRRFATIGIGQHSKFKRTSMHETLLCGPHVRSGFVPADTVPKVGRSLLPLLLQLRTLPTEHRLQQTAHRSKAPGSSSVETGKSHCRAVQFRLVPMFDSYQAPGFVNCFPNHFTGRDLQVKSVGLFSANPTKPCKSFSKLLSKLTA